MKIVKQVKFERTVVVLVIRRRDVPRKWIVLESNCKLVIVQYALVYKQRYLYVPHFTRM